MKNKKIVVLLATVIMLASASPICPVYAGTNINTNIQNNINVNGNSNVSTTVTTTTKDGETTKTETKTIGNGEAVADDNSDSKKSQGAPTMIVQQPAEKESFWDNLNANIIAEIIGGGLIALVGYLIKKHWKDIKILRHKINKNIIDLKNR